MSRNFPSVFFAALAAAALLSGCAKQGDAVSQAKENDMAAGVPTPTIAETKAIAEEAYVYAFPMIANYKAMYQLAIDKSSSQYKGPFNQITNEARVFTYEDTAIVTPNSDTPYSMLMMDLRAEPIVICVPAVEKKRYYSVQFADMYAQNYGYIGSRATGNGAGCYMVTGPDWQGDKPANIKAAISSETQFSLAVFRTQLFNAADMPNVKKVQAGYRVLPLSAFLKKPAPAAAPAIDWPKFAADDSDFKTGFADTLDFLLQFAPATGTAAVEQPFRDRLASIGIGPGRKFKFSDLSVEHKAAVGLAVKDGFEKVEKAAKEIGRNMNGWQVGSAFGNRAFYKGDYLLRAAAAKAGLFGNDAAEATYPMAKTDNNNQHDEFHAQP